MKKKIETSVCGQNERRTDIDDVAFFQLSLVGDPMTNHFVDRTAIKRIRFRYSTSGDGKLLTYKPI